MNHEKHIIFIHNNGHCKININRSSNHLVGLLPLSVVNGETLDELDDGELVVGEDVVVRLGEEEVLPGVVGDQLDKAWV